MRKILKFFYSALGKIYLSVIFCLRRKKNDDLLDFSVVCFFLPGSFCQFFTRNCRHIFKFLIVLDGLSTSFWQFVKKFDNLFSAFSYLVHWSLSQIHPSIARLSKHPVITGKVLAQVFLKNSKFWCKWLFAIDLSLLAAI